MWLCPLYTDKVPPAPAAASPAQVLPPPPPAPAVKNQAATVSNPLAPTKCAALEQQVATHAAKVRQATVAHRRARLQDELAAAKAARTDLKLVLALSQKLTTLKAEKEVTLTEEQCAALLEQHDALVQELETSAWVFADAERYDLTERMYAKIEELKALDASGLSLASDSDPVWVDPSTLAMEDGVNKIQIH